MTIFSTIGLFIALSAVIALVLALIVITPWLRASRLQQNPVDNQLLDINVAVFRERLAELKTDNENGTIDDSHYQNQKLELERQLLDAQRQIAPMVTPNFKSRLIEWSQKNKKELEFDTTEEFNEKSKQPKFTTVVIVDKKKIGFGTGTSKKEAHQNAAGIAIEKLENV